MNKEEYIKRIRKALIVINRRKREDIIKEIESEIEERISSGEKFEDFFDDLPKPEEIRKEYLEIYGPSKSLIFAIFFGILLLSFITIPVLPLTDKVFVASPITLLLLGILIVWFSNNIGIKYSFPMALCASIIRIVVFYLTEFIITESFEPGTDISVIFSSVILAIIPFITIRKK